MSRPVSLGYSLMQQAGAPRNGGLRRGLPSVMAVRGFAIFFFVIGVTAIVVGVHDSSIARAALLVLLGNIGLVLAGILVLVAAYQLFRLSMRSSWKDGERPASPALVPVAFLLVIILGAYVFSAAIATEASQRPIVVGVASALIVVALGGLRFFWREVELTRVHVGATVALGLLGISIGAWEFWYQNQYVPSHLGRAVSLKVDLKLAGVQKGYDVIDVTLNYEDIGGRSVKVIGSTYTLTGARVIRCHRVATPEKVQKVLGGYIPDPQRSRWMTDVWEEQPASLLAAGKFVGDGKRLDANVPAAREFVFFVPRHQYQLLRFRAQLFAVAASVPLSRRVVPEYANFPGDHDLYGFWHIDDDSWFHDLIYGRASWVVTRYEIVYEPQRPRVFPDFRVTARFPVPTWTEARPGAALIERLFLKPQPDDTSEPFADAELALEPIAEPNPRENPHDKVVRQLGCVG